MSPAGRLPLIAPLPQLTQGGWAHDGAANGSAGGRGNGGKRTHSAGALAELLNVSARTLHRQLKEEGASLQQLKDEVRCERAKDLLHRTQRPIKQVAAAVGFVNAKSFARAFREWTGKSPAQFRGA